MATSGRNLTIDWNSTEIASVRSKSYTINNQVVDVTTDDDDGWRALLDTPGLQSVDVSVSGVTSDQVFVAAAVTGAGQTTTIQLPTTTGTLAGTFMITSFEESGEHDGAVEFTLELQSSGEVTYTAGT